MRDYCAKLGRPAVTSENLAGLLRSKGSWYRSTAWSVRRGLRASVRQGPSAAFSVGSDVGHHRRKKAHGCRRQPEHQRIALLDWLAGEDVNPMLRVKRRTTHSPTAAYPARALVELLVNMLVHRDYERGETALIDVHPGRAINFRNRGGLPECVVTRVKPDDAGDLRPVPNVSDLRNRALSDVCFGIQAMERGGTGLSDVEALARDHGGAVAFKQDAKEGSFIARIMQPVAAARSKTDARDESSSRHISPESQSVCNASGGRFQSCR